MQQPPKKYSPKEMAARAYDLFRRAERTRRVLTEVIICRYTGYSLTTMRKHLSTKWRKRFLHGDRQTGYIVNGLIGQITKSEFIEMHRQSVDKLLVPMPRLPVVIEKEVDRYYRLELDSVEIWLVVVGLLVIGWWWRNL